MCSADEPPDRGLSIVEKLSSAPTLAKLLRVADRLMADAESAQDSSPSGPNNRAGRSMGQS